MRKFHKNQIIEMLATIRQAQSVGQYALCQDAALSLCDFIDNLKGEGTETVALLIAYCELLFKANNGELTIKYLRKHVIKIENSINNELKPSKIEIAFISYKAALSDCIESIYLAAKADPACDAYFIPIPYDEINSDSKVINTVYEGAENYPDYIECTDWQSYDIEARRPDIIFTFAPYDEMNYLTRIHTDYYCARLRGLTDMLVYVPYFITNRTVHERLITSSGCLYAHKTILQSERIKNIYSNAFNKYSEYNSKIHGKKYATQYGSAATKFIAMGSPKLDKVINTNRKNCPLPEDWKERIGNKKVFLYNTTLEALDINNAHLIETKRRCFELFHNRTDIVLWYRPHPYYLMQLQQALPSYYNEYKDMLNAFIHAGKGIYDTSPDLHRAITWADAYYGDGGSMWALFGTTGRPRRISKYLNQPPDAEEARISAFINKVVANEIPSKPVINDFANSDGTSGIKIYEYVKNQTGAF
ncbi:MAG: hypothetical protein FWC16_03205 [Defluviitaleaceae bacterium]|nr:hypothetical protein [Defluviitaleaceae bacterium]MCL2273910.1 hypothetical protein [Defluviitaleaceae bacterium]